MFSDEVMEELDPDGLVDADDNKRERATSPCSAWDRGGGVWGVIGGPLGGLRGGLRGTPGYPSSTTTHPGPPRPHPRPGYVLVVPMAPA